MPRTAESNEHVLEFLRLRPQLHYTVIVPEIQPCVYCRSAPRLLLRSELPACLTGDAAAGRAAGVGTPRQRTTPKNPGLVSESSSTVAPRISGVRQVRWKVKR
jgi:hypothetical protein